MSAAIAATAEGDYHDADTVLAFARDVDVVTFDHEHVPQDVLRALVGAGVAVHPGPDALAVAQDKILMRTRLSELGLPVPDWAAVHDADELAHVPRRPRRAGRREDGAWRVRRQGRPGRDRSAAEVDDWFVALAETGGEQALLVEEFVPFTRELAQSVARRPSGEVVAWPLVETRAA